MDAKTFLLPLAVGGKSHIVIEQHGHPPDETFCKQDALVGKRGNRGDSILTWWADFKANHPKTSHPSLQRVGEIDLGWIAALSISTPNWTLDNNICGKCWKSYMNYRLHKI